jgi:hypothetical protein
MRPLLHNDPKGRRTTMYSDAEDDDESRSHTILATDSVLRQRAADRRERAALLAGGAGMTSPTLEPAKPRYILTEPGIGYRFCAIDDLSSS